MDELQMYLGRRTHPNVLIKMVVSGKGGIRTRTRCMSWGREWMVRPIPEMRNAGKGHVEWA